MDILINGQKIDFTLDTEKTVAEVRESLNRLLAQQNQVIVSFTVDGDDQPAAWGRSVDDVGELGIQVEEITVLVQETLENAANYLTRIDVTIAEIEKFAEEEQQAIELDLVKKNLLEGLGWVGQVLQHAASLLVKTQPFGLGGDLARLKKCTEQLAAVGDQRAAWQLVLREIKPLVKRLQAVTDGLRRDDQTGELSVARLRDDLERFVQELPELQEKCLTIAVALQSGEEFKALQIFQEQTIRLQEFITFLQQVQKVAGVDYSKMRTAKGSFGEEIQNFLENLKQIVETFANRDFVLLADLLEYELSPCIETWVQALPTLAAALPEK